MLQPLDAGRPEDEPAVPPVVASETDYKRTVRFVAAAFALEAFCQTDGLIGQPLNFLLRERGLTAFQASAFLAPLSLPWLMKPIYGIVSDAVPLWGYRRKSYLILSQCLMAAAYASCIWGQQLLVLSLLLMTISLATAIISTVAGGLLVEKSHQFQISTRFIRVQWTWYALASIAVALVGGQLVEHFSGTDALRLAAGGTLPLIGAGIATTIMAPETRKIGSALFALKIPGAIARAAKSKELLILTVLIGLFNFNPGIGVWGSRQVLYRYMTEQLHFSQALIGELGAVHWVGWLLGALVFHFGLRHISSKRLIEVTFWAGAAAQLLFLPFLLNASAPAAYFVNGIANMLSVIAILGIATEYCPGGVEGVIFAILMAMLNFVGVASDLFGSYMYEQVFGDRLTPLVFVSVGFTLSALLVLPAMRLGNKRQGETIASRR